MKKFLLIVLFISIYSFSFSQYTKTTLDTKTIVKERSIYLNGGMRASLGGKSRIVIPVDLPKNTVEWFYSFSTKKGTSGIKNLNLALQLVPLLADYTGIASNLTSELTVPKGSTSIDIYLLNQKNTNPFLQKWDNNGGGFSYYQAGTVENTMNAVVNIKTIANGHWYLGLRNPSTLDGVSITIEVVAIVKNIVYIDKWKKENISKLKAKCINQFNTNGLGKNKVCDCLVKNITTAYKPSEWYDLPIKTKLIIFNSKLNECFTKTNNIDLKNEEIQYKKEKEKEKKQLAAEEKRKRELLAAKEEKERKRRMAFMNKINSLEGKTKSASLVGDYSEALKLIDSTITIITQNQLVRNNYTNNSIANLYNNAAWYSLITKQLDYAKEYIEKGLTLNPDNMYLRENLGNLFLVKGNFSAAKKVYIHYKRREKLPDGNRWFEIIGKDLRILESKGLGNKYFDKIRNMLRIK